MNLKALILIGGKSKRMGTEKYLLEKSDQPQYEHLYSMLEDMNLPVWLSCSEEQSKVIPDQFNRLVDHYPDQGPMGGLVTAIETDSNSSWLLVACDLLNLKKSNVDQLIDESSLDDLVTTYQLEGSDWLETTISIYHPQIFPTILKSFEAEERSLQKILNEHSIKTISTDDAEGLKNANRPEDL